jgi:nicotinate-nucleotide adenylyltransferase
LRPALFGGTFDPIHNAHLTVAREAADQFDLTRVLFVPAAHPPHKDDLAAAPYEDRYRMTELACREDPRFVASRLEAGNEKSYSILTIERVRAAAPDLETLYFLIGADAFAEIKSWFRWQDVLRLTDFIVVTRPGHVYEAPAEARVHRLDTPALPVSSSEIRRRIARGGISEELPAAVSEYIAARRLYRS